jgi:hypothetical protein
MFQWYAQAQICYAYLSDVPSGGTPEAREQIFRHSKWFTRGWTLQELLAPCAVTFFSGNWVDIGTKASLEPILKSITGIRDLVNYEKASIAQRMSWASRRQTTRVEDMAYCLLGLFGISMPLLYGEGEKAFLRLQLEILKNSDDESIFAWNDVKSGKITGMLAQHPSFFERSEDIQQCIVDTTRSPYEMTNKGLRMELSVAPIPESADQKVIAPLNCAKSGKPLAIVLTCQEDSSRIRWFRTEGLFQWTGSRTDLIKKTMIVHQTFDIVIQVPQPYMVLVQTHHMLTEGGGFYLSQQHPDRKTCPKWFQTVVKEYEGLYPGTIGFRLGSKMNRLVAAFLCTKSPEESFVIGIYDLTSRLGVIALAAPKDLSWRKYVELLESNRNPSHASYPTLDIGSLTDRASRRVRPRKYVTVVVKKQGTLIDPIYMVEIRIHMPD